jgi:UPF0176 protein
VAKAPQKDSALEQRNTRIAAVIDPLPGSLPYENRRRVGVAERFAGLSLKEFLRRRYPGHDDAYWQTLLDEKRLLYRDNPARGDEVLQAGELLITIEPDTVEPHVDARLRVIYEDAHLMVLDKPAPLPVHPSGRFNKNSATHILALAFDELTLRPVHRLDANTTGLLLLAKTKEAARGASEAFSDKQVKKRYLVEVEGPLPDSALSRDTPIAKRPSQAGGRHDQGQTALLDAKTEFQPLCSTTDGRCLLIARPITGRTNQIRVHLAQLGMPIVGDTAYQRAPQLDDGLVTANRLHLHAWTMQLAHPISGAPLRLQAPLPSWAEPFCAFV